MNKKFWGCVAAVALVVGIGSPVLQYACEHPESRLGRCYDGVLDLVRMHKSVGSLTRHTAGAAFRGLNGLLGTAGPAAVWDKSYPSSVPDGPPVPADSLRPPAVLPGSVVMREEAGLPAEAMPAVPDLVGGFIVPGAIEESEEATMPRIEDDSPRMPKVAPAPQSSSPKMPAATRGFRLPAGTDTLELRPGDFSFLPFIGPI